MDSRQVSQILKGISEWCPFNKESIKSAPKQNGIYILRMAQGKRFGRLKGESDICYIGSTECKDGLRKRLQPYFRPGRTQRTNKRIYDMAKKYDFEIAWCLCWEASDLEHQLLHLYIRDHDELPPLNHSTIIRVRKIIEPGTPLPKGVEPSQIKDKDGNLQEVNICYAYVGVFEEYGDEYEATRQNEEADIMDKWNPPCNDSI